MNRCKLYSNFSELLARPERFELPAPRFVVWCPIPQRNSLGPRCYKNSRQISCSLPAIVPLCPSGALPRWAGPFERSVGRPRKVSLAFSRNEGCQEPALRCGQDAPSSFGRRRGRGNAAQPQKRQHSAARPDAGSTAAGPKLSARGVYAAPRQGSLPEWAETRREMMAVAGAVECAPPGATRLALLIHRKCGFERRM